MKNKRFSIIIPVYKVEKYIKQCVESIINQTFTDFEAIFVDDCGNDSSVEIIEKYLKQNKRLTMLKHNKNRGLSAARNTALEYATGEYLVCLDSDDWLEENCLEVLDNEFRNTNTSSIFFDSYYFNDNEQIRESELVSGNIGGRLTITPENIGNWTDYSWIKAYKTSSIKNNNIYWPEGLTFEDSEFYYKYFSLNPETYIIEDALYNYRIREGSIVTNAQRGNLKIEHLYQIARNIRQFYIERGLYEQYKFTVLELLGKRIDVCKNIANHYEQSLILSKQLMEDFGYPEEFIEYKSYPVIQ